MREQAFVGRVYHFAERVHEVFLCGGLLLQVERG